MIFLDKKFISTVARLVKLLGICLCLTGCMQYQLTPSWPSKTYYRKAKAKHGEIFYRESGDSKRTTIVLLHGYPSSSHTYRNLIPLLSGDYHIIAPDNLGSGYSDKPSPNKVNYTFDVLADNIFELLDNLKVKKYVIYMQDFGAPVGFRLMMKAPDRIKAIVLQNANAYLEGIPYAKREFFRNAQLDKSKSNISKLYAFTGPHAVKYKQYLRDVKGKEEIMSPDAWIHDGHFLSTKKERLIQVQLFQDYKTNLDLYPEWQELIRTQQFPALLVWGKKDPVFISKGARAYKRDLPNAEIHLLDAGHFAVEEKPVEIAKHMLRFLKKIDN